MIDTPKHGNFSDLSCRPDETRFILVNQFNNDEHLVTWQHLQEVFTDEQLMQIKSNRHSAWFVYEYIEE